MVKRYSLTDKQRAQILAAYDAGWGFNKIARVVECTPKEVRSVVLANRPEAHPPGEYMHAYAKLREVFSDEFDKLSNTDAALIGRDYLEAAEEDQIDAGEYARRIGRGNLQSYAEVMRVRAKKGWNKNPLRERIAKIGNLQTVGATIRKNREGEIVVRLWQNGKHYKPADYFTNDAVDAMETARDMVKRASAGIGVNPSANRPEIHIDIDSHNLRNQEEMMRANPGDRYFVESLELANYAIHNAELYHSRIAPIILNLQRKIKRGVYDHALALKLWKYAADDAAQRYTKEYGSIGTNRSYGIFDVKTRMETAEILRDQYNGQVHEQVRKNPTLRATRPAKRKLHSRTFYDAGSRNLPGMGKIYVQKKHGNDWISVAVAPHSSAGRKAAEFWAQRYHRKHPGSTLRLFV